MTLSPRDIDEWWQRISLTCRSILESDPAFAHDLVDKCRRCDALCLVSSDGFVIASLQAKRQGEGFELFVWLAASWGASSNAFMEYLPEVEAVATELGATAIRFVPRRKGWARLALGWVKDGDSLLKEIRDGREIGSRRD